MILHFINAEKFIIGIKELSVELGFQIGDKQEADVIVSVIEKDSDTVEVNLNGNTAEICYGSQMIRFYRGLGLLCEALSKGETNFSKKETPKFTTNGSMMDVARNMVMRPEFVKALLRKQAIMGLNLFMLYLEDVFEVPEYPYFGHMRGRYSKAEIRDMDSYAQIFGIELLPAIQCLGHITYGIQWEAMADLRDTHDALMIGRESVYTFIDKMMASVADCFSTKRLHIGMDEAHNIGCGRYKEFNDYKPQFELFCEHLDRIIEISKKYGFDLMVWSDMFFYMVTKRHYSSKAVFDDAKLSIVPKDVQLVYWKYCIHDPEEMEKVLQLHKKLGDNISFAGGIQTWVGPAPLYDLTVFAAKAALGACMRNGIKEVMATAWCNGSDSAMVNALYGLMVYAEMDYIGEYDEETIKNRFKFICGVDADDIIDLEKLNFPNGKKNYERPVVEDYVNTSKYLLFNDPLIGLMDKHIEGVDTRTYYTNLYEEYKNRGTDKGLFGPSFKYLKALMHILILKADYGIRLKKAYEAKDTVALDVLYEDAIILQKEFEEFRKIVREFYLYYNKPFGYENIDMHMATLSSRFETVRYYLDKLKEDQSYKIDELEEERMYLIAPGDDDRVTLMEYDFGRFFSANGIYKVFDDFYIG